MSEEAKTRLTVDELELIKSLFEKADTNKDKVLSYKEFQEGISGTLNVSQDLFNLFDKNHDGRISFDELVTALAIMSKGTPTQKLEFLFDFYDKDKDGAITSSEIRTLIKHISEDLEFVFGPGQEKKAELEAEAIVKKLDKNGDGKIARAEWLEYAASDPNLVLIFGL
eukprot:Phypoly_transcript_19556.p1 GENE.Phypoly_transcript_19556~~Phypoly_transcript_19556.p1  ORF type:complete len:168 (+),score=36.84 Phypoly_transcript_19556:178-681(+)